MVLTKSELITSLQTPEPPGALVHCGWSLRTALMAAILTALRPPQRDAIQRGGRRAAFP
jgi:hypothetical protein